ncbi:MAG: MFS transporter [Alphaproteobacteria bacterium]|nr:MFS transporter [Alphaproteobacteria bacterium]
MPLRWVMLIVLFLVRLAMGYQFQSVASVSSHLVHDLGLSYAEVGTLIGFFLLPGIVIAIPSGLMTRAVTDRNLLIVGALTMIVGALVMGFGEGTSSLYVGRLITGIGGTIFNVILTKMVTDWFAEHEIITALAIMLTAWPIGISLGLLTQGLIADAYGWPWAMYATGILATVALILTATLYRDPPDLVRAVEQALKLGLPLRQFVHVSIVGVGWTLYNASFIIFVSFVPDVLIDQGYQAGAARSVTSLAMWSMLISIPFGGRVLEIAGWITVSVVVTLTAATAAMLAVSQGVAPEVLCVVFGLIAGIPAGALMALTAEAVSPDNRGPGLGIFYTWYYVGMTLGPALAGWTRDSSGDPAAPVIFGAILLAGVMIFVGSLRLLQAAWPIEAET